MSEWFPNITWITEKRQKTEQNRKDTVKRQTGIWEQANMVEILKYMKVAVCYFAHVEKEKEVK